MSPATRILEQRHTSPVPLTLNNFQGTTATTLYGIDSALDILVRQGSVNGSPVSPTAANYSPSGPLGINTTTLVRFLIFYKREMEWPYASLTKAGESSRLYTINLNSGVASLLGTIYDNDP